MPPRDEVSFSAMIRRYAERPSTGSRRNTTIDRALACEALVNCSTLLLQNGSLR